MFANFEKLLERKRNAECFFVSLTTLLLEFRNMHSVFDWDLTDSFTYQRTLLIKEDLINFPSQRFVNPLKYLRAMWKGRERYW